MRHAATALLAVPITLVILVGVPLRRSARARIGVAFSLSVLVGMGVLAAGRPPTAVATAPVPILPLTQAAFETTVATDRGLTEPVTIHFSSPMDADSVAASLTVVPPTETDLTWSPDGLSLTVAPTDHWSAGVLQTVTVQAGALARNGRPLTRSARAVFLTRAATTGTISATDTLGSRVAVTTGFVVTFARPVDAATVQTAIRLDPPTSGVVSSSSPSESQARFTFQPTEPLRPDTDYRLVVSGVRDRDGASVDPIGLTVHTTTVPGIIRFRPHGDSAGVTRAAVLSVRFSQTMDRRSTARAFSVTVGGKAIAGRTEWAERDTVLVFTPSSALPAGKTVTMTVSTIARNLAGVHIAAPVSAAFKTSSTTTTAPSTPISGGGGAVGGGSWAAVETYYLGLMNCTRTGGWVTSTGACSSPGGRNVAPLKLSSGISSKVSRPYAKKLAVGGECSHFIGGNPGDRLRRAGYTNYTLGREPRLSRRQSPRVSARLAPLLPEREVVQRRPLREHDERQVRPGRDRRLGGEWPRPTGDRLLPSLTGPSDD